ncbi:Regulator of protease activity HflC, stomatin/prohibitin superfamily [Micromonospora pallida]|uniref:Regulator of protease activity HflC, stomatin/prohibitin superfamily n=1 Tax=Micromonospora pallida TaxID=145854 RepID=A0A1C6RZY6_9ACTN|nr:SPFH domain-containing protein [Micromonospora pallida]SCL22725.1 Regulator of protease activity HflC, stomatin/prohibitin superfamily [Micromonospora pallida]
MGAVVVGLVMLAVLVTVLLVASVRVVEQHQRGVVFRCGRVRDRVRQPGLHLIAPVADRMVRVNVQTVLTYVPAQSAMTRDNVPLTVDAVVRHRVVDPVRALVDVRDYPSALLQVTRTALRSAIGGADLDAVLGDRKRIDAELTAAVDASTGRSWGLLIERAEVGEVTLPASTRRSLCRLAEAERERRARVTAADGEVQASRRLAEASRAMAGTPGAYQLRLLQTMADMTGKGSGVPATDRGDGCPRPVEWVEADSPRCPYDVRNTENDPESRRRDR